MVNLVSITGRSSSARVAPGFVSGTGGNGNNRVSSGFTAHLARMAPPGTTTINGNNNENGKQQQQQPLASSPQSKADLPLAQPLDPSLCMKAARYAVRVYEEMSKRSEILKNDSLSERGDAKIALFEREEIIPHMGDLLGKGGFNSVYALNSIQLLHEDDNYPTQKHRQQLLQNKPKLAVKFLSDDAMFSPEEFCNGAADLFMEAKYLAALAVHPHPSIIRLHGMSAAGPAGFGKPERAGCFLLIDRLYDSLDRRIDVWIEVRRRKMEKQDKASKKMLMGLYIQRMLVAQDVASALKHLHSLSIIYRDLKPDNIGFDYNGRVKIFDFGLAKELDPLQRNADGLYQMSGGTGSRRFMAPEVAFSEPYNLSADIYSFGIVLWEILTLEKAFAKMSVDEHRERVLRNHERPELHRNEWSKTLCRILEVCWKRNPFERPSSSQVHRAVKTEVISILEKEFPQQAKKEKERFNGLK